MRWKIDFPSSLFLFFLTSVSLSTEGPNLQYLHTHFEKSSRHST
jgi:hypothetical protein